MSCTKDEYEIPPNHLYDYFRSGAIAYFTLKHILQQTCKTLSVPNLRQLHFHPKGSIPSSAPVNSITNFFPSHPRFFTHEIPNLVMDLINRHHFPGTHCIEHGKPVIDIRQKEYARIYVPAEFSLRAPGGLRRD